MTKRLTCEAHRDIRGAHGWLRPYLEAVEGGEDPSAVWERMILTLMDEPEPLRGTIVGMISMQVLLQRQEIQALSQFVQSAVAAAAPADPATPRAS